MPRLGAASNTYRSWVACCIFSAQIVQVSWYWELLISSLNYSARMVSSIVVDGRKASAACLARCERTAIGRQMGFWLMCTSGLTCTSGHACALGLLLHAERSFHNATLHWG